MDFQKDVLDTDEQEIVRALMNLLPNGTCFHDAIAFLSLLTNCLEKDRNNEVKDRERTAEKLQEEQDELDHWSGMAEY